jgi:hypothetical protein
MIKLVRALLVSKAFYRWIRDLHMYLGLFLGPFVLVYATSTILFNHAYMPWGGRAARAGETRLVRVSVHDAENSLDVAKEVRHQVGVEGEIGFVSRPRTRPELSFSVEKPGRTTSVRVNLATGG